MTRWIGTTTWKRVCQGLDTGGNQAITAAERMHIKTIYKVPTLEEVLLEAKGKVMLNLDKAFDYFHQVVLNYWRKQELPIW